MLFTKDYRRNMLLSLYSKSFKCEMDILFSLFFKGNAFLKFCDLVKVECTQCSCLFEPHHEKTNVLVSDPVGHKPGCTATGDG